MKFVMMMPLTEPLTMGYSIKERIPSDLLGLTSKGAIIYGRD